MNSLALSLVPGLTGHNKINLNNLQLDQGRLCQTRNFLLISLGFGWSWLVLAGLGWSLYLLVLVGLDCGWSWLVLVFVVFFSSYKVPVFVFCQFLCFVSFCVLSVFVFCQFLCFVSFCVLSVFVFCQFCDL